MALDPTLVEAEVNLGLAYQSLYEYESAVRYLSKALRNRPNLLGPNVIVGMDYLKVGSPQKGIPFLQTALKLDPSNRDARETLASSYLAQENFRSAAEQFRRIADLNPDKSEGWFKLGHEYLDLAARLAYRGAHLYPDSAWGHCFLGDLLLQRGRWEEALTEYQKALSIDPQQSDLHESMRQAYLQGQKSQEAEAEFRLVRQLDSQLTLNRDPCKAHQYSRCIDYLKSREHLSDKERLLLGKSYFALQYEPAADALAQVQGVSSENEEASYWLERTYQALGAEAYAQLEESFPDSWRTHQLRAESYALHGRFQDALQEFQAALALRPTEPELHEALGELYLENSDFDAARGELEQTLSVDSSRTHALYLLGRVYVEEKDNERALPYLERALRIQPDLAEANSLLGTAYLRLGQFANAVPRLEKAAPTDHYGSVHYQLFVAYRKLGQLERARKELLLSQGLRKSHLERDQASIMGSPQPETEPQ